MAKTRFPLNNKKESGGVVRKRVRTRIDGRTEKNVSEFGAGSNPACDVCEREGR